MIKISVSQAARIIGISRKEIQQEILGGSIQTHEGLVTLDSLKRAYPMLDLDQDSSKIIKKVDKIKHEAFKNKNKSNIIREEREQHLLNIISELKKTVATQNILISKLKEKQ